jgi:hypothetical protein
MQSRNNSDWAWMQNFANGNQNNNNKDNEICAVAVRR